MSEVIIKVTEPSEGNKHCDHEIKIAEGESSGGNESKVADGQSSGGKDHWLASIMSEEQKLEEERMAPSIQRVRRMFGTMYSNCKDPQVVSFGPCHHGKGVLPQMDKEKKMATKRFVEKCQGFMIEKCYEQVENVIGDARKSYAAEIVANVSDGDFTHMMFLDGCFIACFIEETNRGSIESEEVSRKFSIIVRDMFLFENQLPFVVLFALMKHRFQDSYKAINEIFKFVTRQNTLTNFRFSNELWWLFQWRRHRYHSLFGREYDEPLHLLDILRRMLWGNPIPESHTSPQRGSDGSVVERYTPRQLGSVVELKDDGIQFRKNFSGCLTSVSFSNNFLVPRILLPTIFINDNTICQVLNLIAFESCCSRDSDAIVTAFLKFMKSLIRTADDVKELRAKGILHHGLCSDDDVVGLFHRELLIDDTTFDIPAFSSIERQVVKHRDSEQRVSMARWSHKYFGSPWITITSIVAVFILFLPALQTVFSLFTRG